MKIQRLGFGTARQALRPFIGPRFRWMIVGAVMLGAVLGIIEAVILQTIGELVGFIEAGDTRRNLGPIDNLTANQLTMIGVGATALLVIFRLAETLLTARIGVHPLTIARSRLASTFLSSDFASQQRVPSGTYYELVLAHAVRLGSIGMATATMISSATVAIALSIAALFVSPVAFGLLAAVMALIVMLTAPLNNLAQRLGSGLAVARNDLANETGEAVDAATDARLFAVESPLFNAVNRRIHEVSRLAFKNHAVTQFGASLFQALMLGTLVVMTGIIASLDGEGFASAGTVALLALRAQMAARKAITSNLSIATSAPFAFELRDQIERLPKRLSQGTRSLDAIEDFQAVGIAFSYPAEAANDSHDHSAPTRLLSNLDLRVRRGEHVGILGPSGSGKSTLLAILLGLVEPQHGSVRLNGRDRREYSEASTRRHIAAVQQQPKLITATVADNIGFYRDYVTDDAIRTAARDAGILDEVESWPDGLDTVVGGRGARQVSGGQAQRICIARALAGEPSLLIMDEPTSSIDESGEQLIVDTLAALGDSCAAIIVSHRPASLGSCNRLLTLSDSRLMDLHQ